MASCRGLRLSATLSVVAVITAVAGCASAPSGGPPRRATGSGNQVQAYVQPLPPPPPTSAKKWTPTAVVLGFLHASASYAFDAAAAEQYLVPSLRKSWHPAKDPVAVVGVPAASPPQPYNKPQLEGASAGPPLKQVTLTGQGLATLTETGQYKYTPGANIKYQFILANIGGVWLIEGLPLNQPGLLLTQPDFDSVYQARNLFFYAQAPWAAVGVLLVPDPVYAPLESSNSALNTYLATRLVNGLLKGPGDWLHGAATSAFPPGTRLLKQVTITGRVAKVDLGGAAAHATDARIQLMEAQLRATLDDRSYSAPLASQVQLYLNNVPQYRQPLADTNLVMPVSTGPVPFLVVTGAGSVGQLLDDPHGGAKPATRVGPTQVGRVPITAIAAEPAHGHRPPVAVAVPDQTGCAVFLTASGQTSYHPDVLSTSGGSCTSLSWDNSGNLWAAAGRAVWVLRAQSRKPVQVDVGTLTANGQSGSQILALRMAPDGVRAAILLHPRSGNNKLLLAAAQFDHGSVSFGPPVSIGAGSESGAGGAGPASAANPIAISWLDAYHLAVLTDKGVIFDLPLTGGAGLQPNKSPQLLGAAPDGAQTLTTDGSELVVGAAGKIFASSLASLAFYGWTSVTAGSDPVYPG